MARKSTPLTFGFPKKPPNLKIGAELNRGAWGIVYNGDLAGRPVAVKRIHELLQQGVGEEERRKLFEDFQEESKRLQALNHPHIVGFIGAFNDPRLGPILVMEKMQENLCQFLDKWKKKLQLPKQLRISLEIIRGVAFLHEQTPPLVHRDLNDKNVMLSLEGMIKIGDFGQSKLKKDLYLTTGQPGMVTFMPPEALAAGKSKYNESLDIFSVGVLMLEIGTQQEPLVDLHGIGTIREVERRERDLKVLGEDHPLRRPVLLCLKDNPKERPKASDLQRDVLAMVDGGVQEELGKEKRAKHELAEMCEQLQLQLEVTRKEANNESSAVKALREEFATLVAKKDEEIRRMSDEIRGLQPIADQYRVLFAEKNELQNRFDALVTTSHAVQQMLRDLQSEKAAVDSRVKELTIVVGEVTEENEALNYQTSQLEQKIESFKEMFTGIKSKFEALEVANTQLREAVHLPNLQTLNEGRSLLPTPFSQRHNQQLLAHPPPPNPLPLYTNPGDYRQHGAATYSTPEEQIAPYGKPYSENALIMKQDLPGPHDVMEEIDSPPSSKGDEQHPLQHSRDPHFCRPPAQPTALGDPHKAAQRDPRHKPQFPYDAPSVLDSMAHAHPNEVRIPDVGGCPIKYSASEQYQAATVPSVNTNSSSFSL